MKILWIAARVLLLVPVFCVLAILSVYLAWATGQDWPVYVVLGVSMVAVLFGLFGPQAKPVTISLLVLTLVALVFLSWDEAPLAEAVAAAQLPPVPEGNDAAKATVLRWSRHPSLGQATVFPNIPQELVTVPVGEAAAQRAWLTEKRAALAEFGAQMGPVYAYLAEVAATAPQGYVEAELSLDATTVSMGDLRRALLVDLLRERADALATGDATLAVARMAQWAGYAGALLHSDAGLVTTLVGINLGQQVLTQAEGLRADVPGVDLTPLLAVVRQWPKATASLDRGLAAEYRFLYRFLDQLAERPQTLGPLLGMNDFAAAVAGSPILLQKNRTRNLFYRYLLAARALSREERAPIEAMEQELHRSRSPQNLMGQVLAQTTLPGYGPMLDRAAAFEAEVARWTAAPAGAQP